MQNELKLSEFSETIPDSHLNVLRNSTTYVVAFALKESYDDLATAQQMISTKLSAQLSINSITPTNSIKLVESTHTSKLQHLPEQGSNSRLDINEAIVCKNPTDIESNISASTIDDPEQRKIIQFIDTDDSSNDETKKNKHEEPNPPKILFSAVNYTQRGKHNKTVKKQMNFHKTITPKCNKFKCKTPKNCISNRLEKYYEKSKLNSCNYGIQEGISNISTVVSKSRILRNGLAKVNLLDIAEVPTHSESCNQFNDNNDTSHIDYPSRTRNNSFISNLSDKTLTFIPSELSGNDVGHYDFEIINSAVELPSDIEVPYKSNVINATVAVAYNKSKTITADESVSKNDEFTNVTSLTSELEPLSLEWSKLTSKDPSYLQQIVETNVSKTKSKVISEIGKSDVTLVNRKSTFDVSSAETFDIVRTSSDFNESSLSTLKMDMEHTLSNETKDSKEACDNGKIRSMNKKSILETVIDLGYYPEDTPSTSSNFNITDQKEVFVTDTNQKFRICCKNMGDHFTENEINSNVLKKTFNDNEISSPKKPVILPNNAEIKEMIQNDFRELRSLEEPKHLLNMSEMWDKLAVVLEVSFKKLETSLTDKIVRELKTFITSHDYQSQPIPKVSLDQISVDLEKNNINTTQQRQQERLSTNLQETDRSLQCIIVKNEVIDNIMQTRSILDPIVLEPEKTFNSLEKLRSKLIDCLEELKPPLVVGPEISEEKDSLTISTAPIDTTESFNRLKLFFFGIISFVRENLFVIASVPAFFIVLLLIYGMLVLIINPL